MTTLIFEFEKSITFTDENTKLIATHSDEDNYNGLLQFLNIGNIYKCCIYSKLLRKFILRPGKYNLIDGLIQIYNPGYTIISSSK